MQKKIPGGEGASDGIERRPVAVMDPRSTRQPTKNQPLARISSNSELLSLTSSPRLVPQKPSSPGELPPAPPCHSLRRASPRPLFFFCHSTSPAPTGSPRPPPAAERTSDPEDPRRRGVLPGGGVRLQAAEELLLPRDLGAAVEDQEVGIGGTGPGNPRSGSSGHFTSRSVRIRPRPCPRSMRRVGRPRADQHQSRGRQPWAENKASAAIAATLGRNLYQVPCSPTGGNVMFDGLGTAFSACVMLSENELYFDPSPERFVRLSEAYLWGVCVSLSAQLRDTRDPTHRSPAETAR
jgi:hypothetical protein